MIKNRKPGCKSQHLKKWPVVGFSWLSLFGSWGLLSDGLSVSGLPSSVWAGKLRIFGIGIHYAVLYCVFSAFLSGFG